MLKCETFAIAQVYVPVKLPFKFRRRSREASNLSVCPRERNAKPAACDELPLVASSNPPRAVIYPFRTLSMRQIPIKREGAFGFGDGPRLTIRVNINKPQSCVRPGMGTFGRQHPDYQLMPRGGSRNFAAPQTR
jgi:hypothetical protein